MADFLQRWNEAVLTSAGFFWMAFWAFALGYLISSLIQVLVTRARMQRSMGNTGPKSMALGTFFGFLSSSCSFAALATTRALFQKGAGLAPALAFMLASTNLVIELGIVIAVFLGWQFVVGEYLGGILLILFAWAFVRLTRPRRLIAQARERSQDAGGEHEQAIGDWRQKITSLRGWQQIGQTYVMEWQMVWKDVLIGFTVAGVIAAFVPRSFFETLFIGAGGAEAAHPGFLAVLAQAVVGPLAAFFTFIGSMGNIPLAAVLFSNGVSFAGVMAFIFSDLVVLPVLRINAGYYGWKMAFYILVMLFSGVVITAVAMHYGFAAFDALPKPGSGTPPAQQQHFTVGYGLVLNLLFLAVSGVLTWLWWRARGGDHSHHHGGASVTQQILRGLALIAALWLVGGLTLPPLLA